MSNIPAPLKSSDLTARIAAELAAKLLTPAEVAAEFGFTDEQLAELISSKAFKSVYADACAIWGGGLNSVERARAKADMALEDALLPIVGIIHNTGSTDGAKTDAFKSLAAISSHAPKNQKGDGESVGEKFVLNVSFAGDKAPTVIEVEAPDPASLNHET